MARLWSDEAGDLPDNDSDQEEEVVDDDDDEENIARRNGAAAGAIRLLGQVTRDRLKDAMPE